MLGLISCSLLNVALLCDVHHLFYKSLEMADGTEPNEITVFCVLITFFREWVVQSRPRNFHFVHGVTNSYLLNHKKMHIRIHA